MNAGRSPCQRIPVYLNQQKSEKTALIGSDILSFCFLIFVTLRDGGSVPVSLEVLAYTSIWLCIYFIFTAV